MPASASKTSTAAQDKDRNAPGTGWARSRRLFSAFLREQSDPDGFYTLLADDAVAEVAKHLDLTGTTVVDVGGGAGYFSAAFTDRGANCLLVEPDIGELRTGHANSVIADGYWLPIADGTVDVSFSSNVLEHVRDPAWFIDEMVRVTTPGGVVYLSYTVWRSPWGGHETAPWHLLGGAYAARRYTRRSGHPPKNLFGESMFALGVAPVLRLIRSRDDVTVVECRPRYYPRWCRFLVRLPGLRELVTWNLLVILRRQPR